MALAMFMFGFIMRGVDNYAHAGGFIGGYVAGRLLDPLKPEQISHIGVGVVCLALTVLAIVASVVHFIVQVRAENPLFLMF